MNRRVLMVTAAWPPVARAGVRRPLRLARRLPELGWDPVILTPAPETVFRRLPLMDESLTAPKVEVHRVPGMIPSTRIARAVSRLPGLVAKPLNRVIQDSLRPDQYPEWGGAALRAAKKLAAVDVVWVTGGPFGIFKVGHRIARKLRVPLVLDYRDPWTVDVIKRRIPLGPSLKSLQCLERRLLDDAAAVSYVNTDMLARNVAAFGPDQSAIWVVIPNGFDAADVLADKPTHFLEPTIVYAGACYGSRSMEPILNALAVADERGLPPLLLQIFGELDPAAARFLDKHPLQHRVHVAGRIPACELAAHMRGAAALLLIIGESHRTALSAKLFDYLEVRRPILGYGPAGCDAENLLKHCGVGTWASDQNEAVDALFRIAEGKACIRPNEDALKGYSADVMAERTADLLSQVLPPPV